MSGTVQNALTGEMICRCTEQELSTRDSSGSGSLIAVELKLLVSTKASIPLDDFRLYMDGKPLRLLRDRIEYICLSTRLSDITIQLLMRSVSEIQRGWWHRVETGLSLGHTPDEVRGDKDVVLSAISIHPYDLQYSSFRDDVDIVLVAVQGHGWALQFASIARRDDFAVVLAAVTRTGMALKFASRQLRGNRHIVRAAVKDAGHKALRFACRGLQIELARYATSIQCIKHRSIWHRRPYELSPTRRKTSLSRPAINHIDSE